MKRLGQSLSAAIDAAELTGCENCGEARSEPRVLAGRTLCVPRACRCQREQTAAATERSVEASFGLAKERVRQASAIPLRYRDARLATLQEPLLGAIRQALALIPDPPPPEVEPVPLSELARGRPITKVTCIYGDHTDNARKRLQAHDARDRCGFGLVGAVGAGKTYAAAAYLNAAAEKLVPGRLITALDIADEIKRTWSDKKGDEQRIVTLYASTPMLVLDDIDKLRATPWSCEMLFRVINKRYELGLPVVVTSNHAPSQLVKLFSGGPEDYGAPLVDRLVEMTGRNWINIAGGSRRRTGFEAARLRVASERTA